MLNTTNTGVFTTNANTTSLSGIPDNRSIHKCIAYVEYRCIDKQRVGFLMAAITFVNMPEQMHPGLDFPDPVQQIPATHRPWVAHHFIQNTVRRTMRDHDIGTGRDGLPIRPDRSAAMPVECPIEKPGCDRAAPQAYAFNFDAGIFQVGDRIGQHGAELFGRLLGNKIVVARNQNLVSEGLLGKPIEEISRFVFPAAPGEIAGMHQHIAHRQLQVFVFAMGVGYEYESHGLFCFWDRINMILQRVSQKRNLKCPP